MRPPAGRPNLPCRCGGGRFADTSREAGQGRQGGCRHAERDRRRGETLQGGPADVVSETLHRIPSDGFRNGYHRQDGGPVRPIVISCGDIRRVISGRSVGACPFFSRQERPCRRFRLPCRLFRVLPVLLRLVGTPPPEKEGRGNSPSRRGRIYLSAKGRFAIGRRPFRRVSFRLGRLLHGESGRMFPCCRGQSAHTSSRHPYRISPPARSLPPELPAYPADAGISYRSYSG